MSQIPPCLRFSILSVIFLWCVGVCGVGMAKSQMKADFAWSEAQLLKKGFSPAFVKVLKISYEKKSFAKVLSLNLLGFMSPPSHTKLISDQATNQSRLFIDQHRAAFAKAEADCGVPPEIISSLLWVETRHGHLTGSFHVPSVYLHLLQARREQNRAALLRLARQKNDKLEDDRKFKVAELRLKIKERTQRRSDWALEQLEALAFIHQKKMKDLKLLRGSFAGAFGLPQFIPSSYRVWALASKAQAAPNLFEVDDSVMSVANYLKVHGWVSEKAETHVPALMLYNQSRDYADSILEIARRVREPRGLASEKRPAK